MTFMAKPQLRGRLNATWGREKEKVGPKLPFLTLWWGTLLHAKIWITKFLRASLKLFLSSPSLSSTSFTHLPICKRVPPYEPGQTQDFFLHINPDTEKLDFHTAAAGLKKEETDLRVIEGLCIIMGICGTFLSNCWATSLSGELFPFLEPNQPDVD